jgi:hypothetical protein
MTLIFIISRERENCAEEDYPTMTDTDQEWPCTDADNGLFELFNSEMGEAEPVFGCLNLVKVQ